MPITKACESPNTSSILSTSKDHYAYVWKNCCLDKVDYILYGHNDMVTNGVFITDSIVATSSYDQTVKFWNLK
jgi:WD40 repeat protein